MMTLMVLALTSFCFAQAQAPEGGQGRETHAEREKQQKERIERRAQQQAKELKLDDATTTWFTNLYVEYQTELQQVRREAMKDMPRPEKAKKNQSDDDTATGAENMKDKEIKKLTDEQADKMIKGSFDRTEKELKVKRDYYKRFCEKLSPKQLVRIFASPEGGARRTNQRSNQQQGGFPGGPMGGPGGGFPGGGF